MRNRRKLLSLLVTLATVIGMIPAFGVMASAYSSGDIPGTTGAGTETDPVIVTTFSQLKDRFSES